MGKCMKKRVVFLFASIAFSVLLSACFSKQSTWTIYPGVSGNVIDAKNQKPVALAKVTLKPYTNSQDKDISAITNGRGEFFIPPNEEKGYFFAQQPIKYSGVVIIEAIGYKTFEREFSSSGLGVIRLSNLQLEEAW